MDRDLGPDGGQVHEQARVVLDFWFGIDPARQFARDPALDRAIAEGFGPLRDRVAASGAEGWREDADTLLAAIILLDQFSRNLYRGQAEAFAADGLALSLCLLGIERGYHAQLPAERAAFLLMPLMHAEDAAMQELSVARFEALGRADNAAFARDHRAVFTRFGRFPGRNAALGRESAADELAYLRETGGGW